jgi:hypothetical protein
MSLRRQLDQFRVEGVDGSIPSANTHQKRSGIGRLRRGDCAAGLSFPFPQREVRVVPNADATTTVKVVNKE